MTGRVNKATLVLGGARSGKSRVAEGLLAACPAPLYVATGQALDDEMRDRIRRHRADRGPRWTTVEEPVRLAETLALHAAPALVDCLTLWLTNLLLGGHDIAHHVAALLKVLETRDAETVLVSNEVGLGIVPGDALSRRFRDEAGWLNQQVAAITGTTLLVTAGIPIDLRRL